MSNEMTAETEGLIFLGRSQARPPFPTAVDSTMMKTFRGCPKRFQYEYLHHWKSRHPSIHLHAGAAFASGLEAVRRAFYEQGLSPTASLEAGMGALVEAYGTFDEPHDTAKTLPRMCGALEYYFTVAWPLESDEFVPWEFAPGKRAIEFSFASPLQFDHPVTGEPILYTGRSDFIAQQRNSDCLWIVDDKTTSQLGPKWIEQWDLRSQFTGYAWAAKEVADIPILGCLVRGVSILKTKYEHAQIPTYRPDWQIRRWKEQVLHDLAKMVEAWESGYFDFNLDEECNSYGGCLFKRICLSEPENIMPWLEADYERRRWDPLSREEKQLITLEVSE